MKAIFNYIKPYLFTAFCFIITIVLIKTVEAFAIGTEISLGIYLRSLATNIAVSGMVCICILPIYVAINFLSRKGALLTTSILLSLIILSEISLAVYTAHNGTLLGAELLVRPVSEALMAVTGAFGIFVPIISVVGIIAGFTTIVMLLSKLNIPKGIHIAAFIIIILSIPGSFLSSKLLVNDYARDNYICSKPYFMLSDCIYFLSEDSDLTDFDLEKIKAFKSDNPNYIIPDITYPLERIDNTNDILSQYFDETEGNPDIVILIVESLGDEFINPYITPFTDSLSKQGLYWKNCLSIANRSFGAIPAIISSSTGPNGFQFGQMPDHNSLIKMLKANGYKTNAFYGSFFTFDCIYEYLTAQGIDYMSPFWGEYKNEDKSQCTGTNWGYYDHIMYKKTLDFLKQSDDKPTLNLISTISSHDGFSKIDSLQEEYIAKIDKLKSKYGDNFCEAIKLDEAYCAAILYTDECISNFMAQYKKMPRYNNTIFIITGDHSSGIKATNPLSFKHVPLIIWSPSLKTPKTFYNIVSHNDIAPSLTSLLKNKYGLNTPSTTHYLGNGLDTQNERVILLNQNKTIRQMVYDSYYLSMNTNEPVRAYKIDNKLNFSEEIKDDSIINRLSEKFDIYRYIYNYTYEQNRLTKNIVSYNSHTIINLADTTKRLICKTPNYKPSEGGFAVYNIFPADTVKAGEEYNKIRLNIKAEIIFTNLPETENDDYMNLEFKSINENGQIVCSENILRYLPEQNISKDEKYCIDISKDFVYDKTRTCYMVSIITPQKDESWNPNYELIINRAELTIEGIY